jgi:hypothetical protein
MLEASELVKIKCTGYEKLRITVMVSTVTDGRKLTHSVVLKCKNLSKETHACSTCFSGAHNREGEIPNFSFHYRHSDHTSLLHSPDLICNKPSKDHLHCHYGNHYCLETPARRTKKLGEYCLGKVKDYIGRYLI